MVYTDVSSLYENGEHYDSLYGGASPATVKKIINDVMKMRDPILDKENIQNIYEYYTTVCNSDFKQTKQEEIISSAESLYEYFNCRIYFLRSLPVILKGPMALYKIIYKKDFILDKATVELIINTLVTWNPDVLQEIPKDEKDRMIKIKNHFLYELDLFKDILKTIFSIFKGIIKDDYYIENFINSKPESKLKTLSDKLKGVYETDKPNAVNFMSRSVLVEPKGEKIIKQIDNIIDLYTYNELLDLTYEIRLLLLNYKEPAQVQPDAEPAADPAADEPTVGEPAVGEPAQLQPDAEPAAEPAAEEPAAEDDSEKTALAKKRFQDASRKVVDAQKRTEVEKVKTELDNLVDSARKEKEEPLKKDKNEIIKEIIENEKKNYLSFIMKTGEVPLVVLSLKNDIPTIYEKVKELSPEQYDSYSKRKLDSKEVFNQLGKFFKKIDITIDNDNSLIKEIFTKIDETKKEMDDMIEKYKETRIEIKKNERNLKPLLQTIFNQTKDLDEEHMRLGISTVGVYSGIEKDDIISLLQIFFKKLGMKEYQFISEDDFAVVEPLFTKNQHYLYFKKNMLTINSIIDLIEKYNVYIDSYLSIAKYIALGQICNYLIKVYHRNDDSVEQKTISDEKNILFKNLIKADIIKNYHLNDEMDYSRLFFDGIENTLNSFNQENINHSIIAQITEKFKPTENEVPEGVIVPLDLARDVSEKGVVVPHHVADAAAGGGKRRRLTNKKRNRRERTNKKRRSVRKTNRRNTKKERTPKKRILKTEITPKNYTLKKRRV